VVDTLAVPASQLDDAQVHAPRKLPVLGEEPTRPELALLFDRELDSLKEQLEVDQECVAGRVGRHAFGQEITISVEVQQVKLGVFLRAYHCRRQYYPDCSNERC
jgi:hypothetical protein